MAVVRYLSIIVFCMVVISCAIHQSSHDVALASKAKLAMLLKQGVPSANIKTHSNAGVLQIAGFVNNKQEFEQVKKAIADYLKHDTSKVINNVIIYSAKDNRKDSRILEKNVKGRFEQGKFPVEGIVIQAKSGRILLSGFVNKYVDIDIATTLANSVPGVSKVYNHLLYKQN